MRIEDKIEEVVGSMGLGYIYETVSGANMELDKVLANTQRNIAGMKFPCCLNVVATSGRFDYVDGKYHTALREVQNIRVLFMDQMKFDDKIDQEDVQLINRLKGYAKDFIEKMQRSAFFFNVTSWSWNLRLHYFDANVGVIEVTAIVKEYEGECLDDRY